LTRRQLFIAAGFLVSAISLGWVVSQLAWSTFVDAMRSLDPTFVAIACLSTALTASIRSFRWLLIAGVTIKRIRYFWHSYNIGQLGNFIYPMRGGDILRLWTLTRLTGLPIGRSVTSGVLDRFADAVAMSVALVAVIGVYSSKILGGASIFIVIGLIAALAALLTMFVLYGHRLEAPVSAVASRLPARAASIVKDGLKRALEVASTLREGRRLFAILVLSLAGAFSDYLTIWLMLFAFGWHLPFFAAVTIGVCLHVGVSVPSAPGNVGVFQIAAIIGLGLFEIGFSNAIAYSVALQTIGFLVFLTLGGWAIATHGFRRPPPEIAGSYE